MNYQNGGWYNNPATGKNQQYWNGQWFDTPQQNGGSSANNPASYNNILQQYNDAINKYSDQQLGTAQTTHDLTTNMLNAQNTQALGTQSGTDQASFLNNVDTPDQKNQGSVEYGYNMNLGHDNNVYGLSTTANSQNRQLALNKLANDENWAIKGIDLNQGKDNETSLESLNSRGLLYGQSPTGGYQPIAMGGMTGLAGQQAGLVNTDFANQRGQLGSDYNLNVLGTNQQADQQQNMLNENNGFDQKNLAYGAANDINSQNNQFGYQTGNANNQLLMAKNSINQQKYNDQQSAAQIAKTQAAQQNGITYQ